jgi:hypothetical protein
MNGSEEYSKKTKFGKFVQFISHNQTHSGARYIWKKIGMNVHKSIAELGEEIKEIRQKLWKKKNQQVIDANRA